MKTVILLLSLISPSAFAHGIDYTLTQEGIPQIFECHSPDATVSPLPSLKIFENKTKSVLLFEASDEDSGVTSELIITAAKRTVSNTKIQYRTAEGVMNVVSLGEDNVEGTMTFDLRASALQIWLKTYSFGSGMKQAKFDCLLTK